MIFFLDCNDIFIILVFFVILWVQQIYFLTFTILQKWLLCLKSLVKFLKSSPNTGISLNMIVILLSNAKVSKLISFIFSQLTKSEFVLILNFCLCINLSQRPRKLWPHGTVGIRGRKEEKELYYSSWF